jgi:hypothetical protein
MPIATEKRCFERIHLEEPEWVACEGIGFGFSGRISVLGLGGLLIHGGKTYPIGTLLPLRLKYGSNTVDADCMVRDVEENAFGVEFVRFRNGGEDCLRQLMDRFRA